jgi:hypothetical protein
MTEKTEKIEKTEKSKITSTTQNLSISTHPLESATQLACPTKVQHLITNIKSAKSIRERIKTLENTRLEQLNALEKTKTTAEKPKFDTTSSVNDSNNNITPGVTSFNYLSETERKIANEAKISADKFSMLKVDCILQSKGFESLDNSMNTVQEIVKSGSSVKERSLVSVLCGEVIGGGCEVMKKT